MAITLFNLAGVREILKDTQQETSDFARVYQIYNPYYGAEHSYSKDAYQRWQTLLQKAEPDPVENG